MTLIIVKKSVSISDATEIPPERRSTNRDGYSFLTPFSFSAAMGHEDKKGIFDIRRPRQNAKRAKICGMLPPSVRKTKRRGTVSSSAENHTEQFVRQSPVVSDFLLTKGLGTFHRRESCKRDSRITNDSKEVDNSVTRVGKQTEMPPERPRSKSDPTPQQTKCEHEVRFKLRQTRSMMTLPHLRSISGIRDSFTSTRMSNLVLKFPEKSVLSLAQDENDRTQVNLSCSSVVSTMALNNVRRRRGDSGVHITDEAVLTWRRDEGPSQWLVRRVSTKSSLQSNYIPSLENVIEEPLDVEEVKATLRASIPSWQKLEGQTEELTEGVILQGWKDIGEVVVSHWTRSDQQQSEIRLEFATNCDQLRTGHFRKSCSFEHRTSSSLCAVNKLSHEFLACQSSPTICGSEKNSEMTMEKISGEGQPKKGREDTETSENMSFDYTTELEKEALGQIKRWRKEFTNWLDQRSRQWLGGMKSRRLVGGNQKIHISTPSPSSCPLFKKYTSSSCQERNIPGSVLDVDETKGVRHSLEFQRVCDACETDMKVAEQLGTVERLLGEVEKKRTKYKKQGENRGILQYTVESGHSQETGRIANDVVSLTKTLAHEEFTTSTEYKVRRLLTSLRENIDSVFLATINHVTELIDTKSSPKKEDTDVKFAALPFLQELFSWKIKTLERERDHMCEENDALKKRIADLEAGVKEQIVEDNF